MMRQSVVLVLSCTALSIVLSGSAFAQFQPKIDLSKGAPADPSKEAYRKEIDKEYQSKLKTIPDQPQKKADPWGNIRPNTSQK